MGAKKDPKKDAKAPSKTPKKKEGAGGKAKKKKWSKGKTRYGISTNVNTSLNDALLPTLFDHNDANFLHEF